MTDHLPTEEPMYLADAYTHNPAEVLNALHELLMDLLLAGASVDELDQVLFSAAESVFATTYQRPETEQ